MADENIETKYYDSWGLSDEEKGYLQASNYDSASSLIKALKDTKNYVGLDKNDLVRIPKADADGKRDLSEVWKQLGRPEKAEDYGLDQTDLGKEIAPVLYEAGLTKDQVMKLAEFMDGYGNRINEGNQKKVEEENQKSLESLQKEWGADFKAKEQASAEAMRTVASKLGWGEEQIDKMQSVLGFADTMKLFNFIAGDEKSIENMAAYNAGNETPEVAAYKIQQLKGDKEFVAKLAAMDSKAIAEMNRLTRLAMKKQGE